MALPSRYGIEKKINSMEGLSAYYGDMYKDENGGKGSGNFGHKGRPGLVGGSGKGGISHASSDGEGIDDKLERARRYSEDVPGTVQEADIEAARSLGLDPSNYSKDGKEFWAEAISDLEDQKYAETESKKGGDGKKYGKYSRSKATLRGEARSVGEGKTVASSDYNPEDYRDIARAIGVSDTVGNEGYNSDMFVGVSDEAQAIGRAQSRIAGVFSVLGKDIIDAGQASGRVLDSYKDYVDESFVRAKKFYEEYEKAVAKGGEYEISKAKGATARQIKGLQARDKALKEVYKELEKGVKKAHDLKPNYTDEYKHKDFDVSDVVKDW